MARRPVRATGVRVVHGLRLAGCGTRARHDQFCLLVSSGADLDGLRHLAWHWGLDLGRSVARRGVFLLRALVDPTLVAGGATRMSPALVKPGQEAVKKSTRGICRDWISPSPGFTPTTFSPTRSTHRHNSSVPSPCILRHKTARSDQKRTLT